MAQSWKNTIITILATFLGAVAMRLLFLIPMADQPSFFYMGNPIPIWTHDAGLYGNYANRLADGISLPFIAEYMPGFLLYGLSKLFGITHDSGLFWFSAFLPSLIVVPIVLIGKLHGKVWMGVLAGLLCSSVLGYYTRSHLGYYDTDILNLLFPTCMVYGMMLLIKGFDKTGLAILLGSSYLFGLWYHSFEAITLGLLGGYMLYVLVFERQKTLHYAAFCIAFVVFLPLGLGIKFALMIGLGVMAFLFWQKVPYYYAILAMALGAIGGLLVFDISALYARALDYISTSRYLDSPTGLKFYNTLNIVSEAKGLSFEAWGEKMANHLYLAIAAGVGYLYLCFKERTFLLFLPLFALGIASMEIGARFSYYGVVPFAFGLAFLGVGLGFKLDYKFYKPLLGGASIVLVLFFGFKVFEYSDKKTPVFNQSDLEVINKLQEREPFILAWWDYGWPLWYYANASTIIDNGKHGEDSYFISYLLNSDDQSYVANASKRIAIQFPEARREGYYALAHAIFNNANPDEALNMLGEPIGKIEKKTYWFLHTGMLSRINNIKRYSNRDLKTGKRIERHIAKYLIKTEAMSFDEKSGAYVAGNRRFPAKSYYRTNDKYSLEFGAKNRFFHVIETPTHFLICNDVIYDSFLVQMLLLENYDKRYFKPVAKGESALLLEVL